MRGGNRSGTSYLLTGHVHCGACNGSVSGAGGKGELRYYRCSGIFRQVNKPKTCDEKLINASRLNETVWSCIAAVLRDPSGIIADLLSNMGTGNGEVGDEKKRVETELRKLGGEEMCLAELRRKDIMRIEVVEDQMGKLNTSRRELELQLKELSGQERLAEDVSKIEGRIRSYCERLCERLDDLDFDGKRAVLGAFGVQVHVKGDDWWMTAMIDPGFMVNDQAQTCPR